MRINELIVVHQEEMRVARYAVRQAVLAMTGLQVFIGLAAATSGNHCLGRLVPDHLSLVAMLAVSGAFVLSDAAIAGRLLTVLRR